MAFSLQDDIEHYLALGCACSRADPFESANLLDGNLIEIAVHNQRRSPQPAFRLQRRELRLLEQLQSQSRTTVERRWRRSITGIR